MFKVLANITKGSKCYSDHVDAVRKLLLDNIDAQNVIKPNSSQHL